MTAHDIDIEFAPRVFTLYRFYDATDQLLYVGLTINPGRRMEKHRGRAWWPDVARITLEKHPNISALRAAERQAIETELPLHNVRMNELCDARIIANEGCSEYLDDEERWCGAEVAYLACGDVGPGLFVCAEHAHYYWPLKPVARVFK